MTTPQTVPTLFWFDLDLRLDDNPALAFAAAQASRLLCVYCHDPARSGIGELGIRRQGTMRQRFVGQSLAALSRGLSDAGQVLNRLRGDPRAALRASIDAHAIRRVVRSRSFGVDEIRLWQQLQRDLPAVEFVEVDASTLFTRQQVESIRELPETFSRFRRRIEKMPVAAPLERCPLPPPPHSVIGSSAESGWKLSPATGFVGGEAAANDHLHRYFDSPAPSRYKKTRNALDGWDESSKMSPWLAAGCLSVRRLYQAIQQYEARHGANESTYWLYFELLWREYFQWYALRHAEKLFLPGGLRGGPYACKHDADRFRRWCLGKTEWPLVNACMKQLNRSGYLSNRARQVAASALVNELELDWRCGAAYFEKQLIDYDVGSNWGNWQYIAGVGADPRGGRHFDLDKQARQFDADGSYVARWLP